MELKVEGGACLLATRVSYRRSLTKELPAR